MPILYSKKGATIKDVLTVLQEAKKRFPVMHLSPFDRIVNGDYGYVMSRQMDGYYSLKPNLTKQGLLFRGDSLFQHPFHSRYKKENENGNNVKYKAFKHLIESFPLYSMFKEGVKLPDGKVLRFENPYALAYLYGLSTPYVGLTSDIEVASFYAVTKWNEEKQQFEMVKEGEGIMYAYELRQPLNQTRSLNPLGLQIFKRTYYQKTYVLQLHENADFNKLNGVTGFKFNHDEELTKEIFHKFEGGAPLAPEDDLLYKKLNDNSRNWQDNPEFTREELEESYAHVNESWKRFIELISFSEDEDIYRDALLKLPQSNDYAKYFDLNRYYNEE